MVFEAVENDRGLPTDRTITAHLLVQAIERQPEALRGGGIGQPHALDASAQFVAGNIQFRGSAGLLIYSRLYDGNAVGALQERGAASLVPAQRL
jgi:hypothetical protein